MKRMNKILAAILLVISIPVMADDYTFTAGYAQSDISKFSSDPKGFNIKYHYEGGHPVGIITSFSYAKGNSSDQRYGEYDNRYMSLMVGPSYRLFDWFAIYAMVGAAEGRQTLDSATFENGQKGSSKSGYAGSVGVQMNIANNFSIDTSYEYARVDKYNINTLIVGVGYKF